MLAATLEAFWPVLNTTKQKHKSVGDRWRLEKQQRWCENIFLHACSCLCFQRRVKRTGRDVNSLVPANILLFKNFMNEWQHRVTEVKCAYRDWKDWICRNKSHLRSQFVIRSYWWLALSPYSKKGCWFQALLRPFFVEFFWSPRFSTLLLA